MEDTDSTLQQAHEDLDALIEVASHLEVLSQESADGSKIGALQDKQQKILDAFVAYAREREKTHGISWYSAPISTYDTTTIDDKIARFHDLNNTFIKNITIRKHLVQIEIEDINKAQHALNSLQSYSASPAAKNYTAQAPRNRINALS
jgi:hypothetical protein